MRPVVWSHSSINTYLDCHLKWYFAYVALEEEEPSEARSTGIEVHDYAEARLKGEDVTALAKPDVIALLQAFDESVLPTYMDPALVEADFQYELDGIPVSGVIDTLDRQYSFDGPAIQSVLRDLKTTRSRPRKGKYRLQLTIYWLGATELGFPPDRAQLDYLVRTKVPYYWPEFVDPIDDDDVEVLSATLQAVQDGVERRDYEPTGLGTLACSYCGYKAICGPYQRWLELTNPIREEAR